MILIMVILPRPMTKKLRHFLAPLIMGMWVRDSSFWSRLYEDLWQEGNGAG